MDPAEARLKCLELTHAYTSTGVLTVENANSVVKAAKVYADFVIGEHGKETTKAHAKGADDHLAEKPGFKA